MYCILFFAYFQGIKIINEGKFRLKGISYPVQIYSIFRPPISHASHVHAPNPTTSTSSFSEECNPIGNVHFPPLRASVWSKLTEGTHPTEIAETSPGAQGLDSTGAGSFSTGSPTSAVKGDETRKSKPLHALVEDNEPNFSDSKV